MTTVYSHTENKL